MFVVHGSNGINLRPIRFSCLPLEEALKIYEPGWFTKNKQQWEGVYLVSSCNNPVKVAKLSWKVNKKTRKGSPFWELTKKGEELLKEQQMGSSHLLQTIEELLQFLPKEEIEVLQIKLDEKLEK
jgi:hypothetical protein